MPIGDRHRERRGRNLAMAWVLAALVALFFIVTIVKMKGA